MNLPASRNTNYGPGSPILSPDLNALQDCIIGAKHPQLTIVLGGTAFASQVAGGAMSNAPTFDGLTWSGHFNTFCQLWLPVGTRLVSIEWFYNTGGAGHLFNGRVDQINSLAALGAFPNVAALDNFSDNTSAGGVRSSGVRAVGHVALVDEILRLGAASGDATPVLHAARIIFDRL